MRRAILAAGMLALTLGPAFAQDVDEGHALVLEYCAVCHAVARTDSSPHPEAPPFRELHERYDVEWLSEGLVEGLVSGHPDMPEFEFDPVQAESIVAYLKSLEAP